MNDTPALQCEPELKGGEYVCRHCGWGRGVGLAIPFHKNCERGNGPSAAPFAPVCSPGPGDHLHRLLARFGFRETHGCKCRSHITRMNTWGVDGCRERVEEITSWLIEEGRRRKSPLAKLPGARPVARRLVLLAIKKAAKHAG